MPAQRAGSMEACMRVHVDELMSASMPACALFQIAAGLASGSSPSAHPCVRGVARARACCWWVAHMLTCAGQRVMCGRR
eukprot:2736929-Alexandrium_andersonii.AAC.1